nr:hypothetical protein Itr_chr04CG00870 [Ipomoea trifida]
MSGLGAETNSMALTNATVPFGLNFNGKRSSVTLTRNSFIITLVSAKKWRRIQCQPGAVIGKVYVASVAKTLAERKNSGGIGAAVEKVVILRDKRLKRFCRESCGGVFCIHGRDNGDTINNE